MSGGIFVAVGTQLPFDRLTLGVDAWAMTRGAGDIFCQTGATKNPPSNIEWSPFLSPGEFTRRIQDASLIVGHAGMGTIFSAMEHGKPLVIMPREADRGEHRNDHQIATAREFGQKPGIYVVTNTEELFDRLDAREDLEVGEPIAPHAPEEYLAKLRSFAFKD